MAVFIVVFMLFSFVIDSGGPIGIRILALGLAMLVGVWNLLFLKSKKIELNFLISVALLFIFSILGFISATINGITISAAYIWIFPVASLPIFYFFFLGFKPENLVKGIVYTGWLFSIVILITFASLFFIGEPLVLLINKYEFPGWFYIRGDGFPQVYFQATLVLVLIAIYAFLQGYNKSALFFSLILLLCLSRFGFITILVFFVFGKLGVLQYLRKYITSLFVLQSFIFLIICLVIYLQVGIDFVMDGGGFQIRLGHLISIFNTMNFTNLIIGMGPGSEIFSIGFEKLTNNIEISQLELIRKYGFLGYFIYTFIIYFMFTFLRKRNKTTEIYALYGFYIVAYSNPVLLSFAFSVFAGCLLATDIRESKS